MDPEVLARGVILGFTIAAAVGPISLLVIRRTLAEGRIVGLVSGLGVATADGTYGAIAAFGLGAITDILVGGQRLLGLAGGGVPAVACMADRTRGADRTGDDHRAAPRPGRRLPVDPGPDADQPDDDPVVRGAVRGARHRAGEHGGCGIAHARRPARLERWWLVLTLTVGALRSKVTRAWLGRINVASGIVIGIFAIVAIGTAIRG